MLKLQVSLHFAMACLAIMLVSGCSSLRRSAGSIRQTLLEKTPLGMQKRDVEGYLSMKDWTWTTSSVATNESVSLLYPDEGSSMHRGVVNGQQVVQLDRVELGTYVGIPKMTVFGCWLFGANNQLVEVWV